jgi:hypothetical protein
MHIIQLSRYNFSFFVKLQAPGIVRGPRPPDLIPHQSSLRIIFPLMVLGSSSRNSTMRGYL